MHYHYSKLYTIYKRGNIQVIVWSGVICTTTVQNYTLYTVYKRDIIQVVVWNRVICTTTVEKCTLSTSATLYRWLFGAVIVAILLLKTIHCRKRDIIQVVVWSSVSCTTTVQNYTLYTVYKRDIIQVVVWSSKLYTVYKHDIIQVVVSSRVS